MTIGRIPSVEGGIQPTIFDAKADILTATAADTPARLAVGNNGETLVADSAATTGLRWQADWNTGKNKIINGDFRINQRNFSSVTVAQYGFDRWLYDFSGGTVTYSAQTFTAGTAPVTGYEGTNFARIVTASQSTAGHFAYLGQCIEDVRTITNQTVTVSFWAKAGSGTPNVGVTLAQNFGTGGSAEVPTSPAVQAITTSWARYSFTLTLPSIAGKTINANNKLFLYLFTSCGTTTSGAGYAAVGVQNATIDFWGVQVEQGSVATPFTTATGTLQGELAACQRYYQVIGGTASGFPLVAGYTSTTGAQIRWPIYFCSQMRTSPTITKNGTWNVGNAGQPSAVFIDKTGFSIQIEGLAAGNAYAYPDGTDDTFTISAEL